MLAKLLQAGLIIFAFGGGYFFAMLGDDGSKALEQSNQQLVTQNNRLTQRNQRLEQTLDLVKRQIQTDRIAYESLQKSVDTAEQERIALLQKFQSQRELLDRLKKKLD
ncbi:MAG: hypothetical protein WBM41_15725 [Arenicellales bacterium]